MKNKILLVILFLIVIVLAALLAMKYFGYSNNNETNVASIEEPMNAVVEEPVVEEKKVQIWNGNSRSVAVMIDNVGDALPQAGINDAAIVYEVTVEGGLTRLMAVYKDVKDETKTIGPVRSARPVYIDYALENDSIFVHFGYSDLARKEIDQQKIINNVNGLVADSVFSRTKEKKAPHNAITNMQKMLAYAQNKGYTMTSEKRSVLNYVVDEVELEEGQLANTVNIPYTSSYKVSFKYNEETKLYERYVNNKVQHDWITNDVRTAKNVIVTFAHNYSTAEENGYGRQKIENIGKLKGYYITDGKTIDITCEKTSRSTPTVYKDSEGNEIEVNDGNTYIQIVPITTNVTFE